MKLSFIRPQPGFAIIRRRSGTGRLTEKESMDPQSNLPQQPFEYSQ